MKVKIFLIAMLVAISLAFQDTCCQAGVVVDLVRNMLEEVMAIQTNPKLQGPKFRNTKRAAIKKIIAENFHFDEMAKQSLGKYWEELSGTKRSEFKAIFQDLFQDSYTRLVLDFLRQEKILYTKEDIQQGQAMVKTTIVRMNEEIPVDYFLTVVQEKWLIQDVNIDGVSIVQNYQKSFSRVIKQESFESLLKKMLLKQQAIEKPL
jgi:phospholipid transport system substrate-binding protein